MGEQYRAPIVRQEALRGELQQQHAGNLLALRQNWRHSISTVEKEGQNFL